MNRKLQRNFSLHKKQTKKYKTEFYTNNKKILILSCVCLLLVLSSFFPKTNQIGQMLGDSFSTLYENWEGVPYQNDFKKNEANYFSPHYLPKSIFSSSYNQPLDDQLIDGRFTIGYGEKSILFGYPYSFSTSHFVLKSSGKYASNNPELSQTRALKGVLISEMEENSDVLFTSKVIYTYDNLLITQTLVPVDTDLEDIENISKGNYYKIEYEIENQSDAPRDIEFTLLLDPMINADDICKLSADGSHIGMDRKFEGAKMPFHFAFYNGNLQAKLITKHKNVISPDVAYVGQWAYLTNVLQLEQQKVGKYTDDSAILLRWNTKKIKKGEIHNYRVFYGVPKGKEGINLQHHQPDRKSQITLYFDANQSQLSSEEEAKLRNFIGARRWKAALVEGYTDAKGTEQLNLELSKDRISHVSYALQMFGIKYEKILRKSHGEFFARNDETARGNGDKKDRKVVVTVWR
ncbi:OmpA family protein [Bernardetia sp. ABR2-2B]|uniref:OmpA family protein n=1 Tax=Bernardetia sp. ABR2-2B TaxID=3127472 RepID=UPI0030D4B96A